MDRLLRIVAVSVREDKSCALQHRSRLGIRCRRKPWTSQECHFALIFGKFSLIYILGALLTFIFTSILPSFTLSGKETSVTSKFTFGCTRRRIWSIRVRKILGNLFSTQVHVRLHKEEETRNPTSFTYFIYQEDTYWRQVHVRLHKEQRFVFPPLSEALVFNQRLSILLVA